MAVVRQNLDLYEVLRERDPEAARAKLERTREEARSSLETARDLSMTLRGSGW
jgi:signal transduction histidine kinase